MRLCRSCTAVNPAVTEPAWGQPVQTHCSISPQSLQSSAFQDSCELCILIRQAILTIIPDWEMDGVSAWVALRQMVGSTFTVTLTARDAYKTIVIGPLPPNDKIKNIQIFASGGNFSVVQIVRYIANFTL